ncbi:MAG TPA: amidase family protein, partial [Thermosynergistes sp.]|nr:amidase family protein [Thermosynergistes sp.]
MELWKLPAWKIAEEVRRGNLSASQVVESHIRRMESLEPSLNAMITPMPEEARRRALAVDEALSKGTDLPLAGVPVAVKDLLCTKGIRTTCG